MRDANSTLPRSRRPLVPHERLDAYWFARMLLLRVLAVAKVARCKSTIGRRLDSALGRVIRFIVEAADGGSDKATDRLQRARATLGLALSHIDDLALRGVRNKVITDLREKVDLLLDRLRMLESESMDACSASNCLPTVLDDEIQTRGASERVDVVGMLGKLPAAAVDALPQPILREDADAAKNEGRKNGKAVPVVPTGQDTPQLAAPERGREREPSAGQGLS